MESTDNSSSSKSPKSKRVFGKELNQFFTRLTRPADPPTYDLHTIRSSLKLPEEKSASFLPFLKERDGMNRLRCKVHKYTKKNEIHETLEEAKRDVKKHTENYSKAVITSLPHEPVSDKFLSPQDISKKRFVRTRTYKQISTRAPTNITPNVGEYEVNYPESHANAYIPQTGRESTAWLQNSSSDIEVSYKAAKAYMNMHNPANGAPNFKLKPRRGLVKDPSTKIMDKIGGQVFDCMFDSTKRNETEQNCMEWLKRMKYSTSYKQMHDLETEVKSRMKHIDELIPRKKK